MFDCELINSDWNKQANIQLWISSSWFETNKHLIVNWWLVIWNDSLIVNWLTGIWNKQPSIVTWLILTLKKTKQMFDLKETNRQTNFWLCGWSPPQPRERLQTKTPFLCLHFIHQRLQRGSQLVRSLSLPLPCTPWPHLLHWFPIFPRMPFSSGKTRAANLPHQVKAKRHSDTSRFELSKCEGGAHRWGVTEYKYSAVVLELLFQVSVYMQMSFVATFAFKRCLDVQILYHIYYYSSCCFKWITWIFEHRWCIETFKTE